MHICGCYSVFFSAYLISIFLWSLLSPERAAPRKAKRALELVQIRSSRSLHQYKDGVSRQRVGRNLGHKRFGHRRQPDCNAAQPPIRTAGQGSKVSGGQRGVLCSVHKVAICPRDGLPKANKKTIEEQVLDAEGFN